MAMFLMMMLLCMSNLNVMGVQISKHHMAPLKLNLLQTLFSLDLNPDINASKVDTIIQIIHSLIHHQSTQLATLRSNVNRTRLLFLAADLNYTDMRNDYLRRKDELRLTEAHQQYLLAQHDEKVANETAKIANISWHDYQKAFDESDLDLEIILLGQIKDMILKLITPPTAAPTQLSPSPTPAPTRSPTIMPPVRLTAYPRGQLEVKTEAGWNEVCGNWFSKNNNGANSTCKALGYPDGGSVHSVEGTLEHPFYVGECLPGELPGNCTGRCCEGTAEAPGDNFCRNKINCGDCVQGVEAVVEIECLGERSY